jgi:hypothetical protein
MYGQGFINTPLQRGEGRSAQGENRFNGFSAENTPLPQVVVVKSETVKMVKRLHAAVHHLAEARC